MRFMVATPQSLIIRCIREKDFDGARHVIEFFDLTKSQYNDMVNLAEKVHRLRSQLPHGDDATGIAIDDAIYSLSDMEKFLIAADISICISRSKMECQGYLEQSRALLKRFSGQASRLSDVSAALLNYLTRLENLLVGDLSTWGLTDSASLSARLSLSDSFPTAASTLSEFIRLRNSLSAVSDQFQKAVSNSSATIVEIESLLSSSVKSLEDFPLAATAEDGSQLTSRSESFLLNFSKQLLFLGNSLREEQNAPKTKNFFDLLKKRPHALLSELVLNSRNLKRAESIASHLDIDLLGVILHSLGPGTFVRGLDEKVATPMMMMMSPKRPNSFASSGPFESPSGAATVSPQPLIPSISSNGAELVSPPGHAGLALTPTVMTSFDSDRRWLPVELIEFMRKRSPVVAILACVLRAPTDRVDPTLLENALTASAKAFPTLHNWVLQKARELALFDSIHLQKRFDKVATISAVASVAFAAVSGASASRRRTETQFNFSNPTTPTKRGRTPFQSPTKDGSAVVYGDKEDPLALGSTLMFEPLFGSGSKQPQQAQSSTSSGGTTRSRTDSSARRRLPTSDAPVSSQSARPAIVDTSFADSSDDEDSSSAQQQPRHQAMSQTAPDHLSDEGDIDLNSTPSSFSPSSFDAYRHQRHVAGVSTSAQNHHNGAISFSRVAQSLSADRSAMPIGPGSVGGDMASRALGSPGSAIGAQARSMTNLMQSNQLGGEVSASTALPRPTAPAVNEASSHLHVLALFDGSLNERPVEAVDSRHLLEQIVRADTLGSEHALFKNLTNTLVQSGKIDRAMSMAENCLPGGASDDLILKAIAKLDEAAGGATKQSLSVSSGIQGADPRSNSWELVLRLRDKTTTTPNAVFNHFRYWELPKAIDMMFMCERHLAKKSASDPSFKEILLKVQEVHRRLGVYRDALLQYNQESSGSSDLADDLPVSPSSKSRASQHGKSGILDILASQRWQQLDAHCERDLPGVIATLTDSSHFNVARKLTEHFKATELKVKIEERYLLHLLTEETDTRTVKERLLSLDKSEAIRVAESLLESVSTNEHRLFLIQFLMERKSDGSTSSATATSGRGSLSTKELGVKILLRLPQELQSFYQNFINQPLVILESLFMSEQTSVLSSVLKDIPDLRNDNIVITYAAKALNTSRLTSPSGLSAIESDSVGSPRNSGSITPSSPMKKSSSSAGLVLHRNVSSSNLASAAAAVLPVALSPASSLALFTDETSIETVRAQHEFPSSPNHQLATAFLDLCGSARVASSKCIEICDGLSNKLQSFRDRLEVVRIIQQLLVYAKLRLMKELDTVPDVQPISPRSQEGDTPLSPRASSSGSLPVPSASGGSPFSSPSNSFAGALQSASTSSLVSLCDTLLSRIELLQQLLFSAPDLFQSQSLSLSVFADPTKIRLLRDKLLEQDRLDTALLVAAKCSIESEPVWAAKALQMLQSGRYQEAKQLFKYCLVSVRDDDDPPPPMVTMSRAAVGISVAPNRSPSDNAPLLQKILRVLESGAPLDYADLRRQYQEILAKVSSQPAFVKKLVNYSESGMDSMKLFQSSGKKNAPAATGKRKHTLDSLRYMQCVYYLQRYGTSEDLIQFWLRHGLIEDAMRHVVSNHLDARYFNIIVMHAISHNLLARIKEWVMKPANSSSAAQEYLLATCKHLNTAEMFKLLLEFQLMMKDSVRAGLTCIKIFNRIPPQDFGNRLNYLNLAKKYFQQGLEEPAQEAAHPSLSSSSSSIGSGSAAPASPLASKTDISKYVRTANLQIRVTTFVQQNAKTIPADLLPPNISLFQNAQRRALLAEMMLVLHNFDLAFAIIQEYRLPTQKIYQTALVSMAMKQQGKKIDEVLKMVKPWLSETEWDEIILAVVKVYMETHGDASSADNFASKLRSESNKIEATIIMRKLKQAYLSAVKMNSIELVQRIREEAKRLDMKREYELCEKFLQSRVQT